MRATSRPRIAPVLLMAFTFAGCGALEEIDKANAKLPARKPAPTTAQAETAAETSNPLLERSKEWWDQAKSLSSTESKGSIVRCELAGTTQFMDHDDCRARGGSVSG